MPFQYLVAQTIKDPLIITARPMRCGDRSTITAADKIRIKRMHKKGMRQVDIARRLDVPVRSVGYFIRKERALP